MKKALKVTLLFAMIVFVVALFPLVGCKTTTAEETTVAATEETTVASETTVTTEETKKAEADLVYDPSIPVNDGKEINLIMWDNGTDRQPFFEKWSAAYTKIHPNVKIKFEVIPAGSAVEFFTKTATAASAGSGPDMFWDHNEYQAIIGPISAPFPEDTLSAEMLKKYFGFVEESKSPDGKLYYIPIANMTSVVLYNKTIWKEAGLTENDIPKTWDKLMEIARKLTKYDDAGKVVQAGFATGAMGTCDIWRLMQYQQGKFLFKEDGSTAIIDSPEGLKAAQFMYDLYYGENPVDNPDFPAVVESFGGGRAAMATEWGWIGRDLNENYPDLEWGSFHQPTFDGEVPPAYDRCNGEISFGISNKVPKENQAVAFDFLKFVLCNDEACYDFNESAPNKFSIAENPDFSYTDIVKVEMEIIDRTIYPGNLPSIYSDDLSKLIVEAIILVKKDPAEAIKDAQAQVDKDMVGTGFVSVESLYKYASELRY